MGTPIVGDLLSVMLKNPFLAYFTVLAVLAFDSFLTSLPVGLGALLGGEGVIGFTITTVLNTFGVPIVISSFQIMVLSAVVPVVLFVLRKSGRFG